MAHGDQPGDEGSGGGRGISKADRQAFADVVLHWNATVAALRLLVDSWDVSISAMCESRDAGQRNDRDRQVVAALKTIQHLEKADALSAETKVHIRNLVEALGKMR